MASLLKHAMLQTLGSVSRLGGVSQLAARPVAPRRAAGMATRASVGKRDLINTVREKTGSKLSEAEAAVNATLETIVEAVARGEQPAPTEPRAVCSTGGARHMIAGSVGSPSSSSLRALAHLCIWPGCSSSSRQRCGTRLLAPPPPAPLFELSLAPAAAASALPRHSLLPPPPTAGEKVTIPSFGTFEARVRAARQGRNPQTGETIQIKESVAPAFSAGERSRSEPRPLFAVCPCAVLCLIVACAIGCCCGLRMRTCCHSCRSLSARESVHEQPEPPPAALISPALLPALPRLPPPPNIRQGLQGDCQGGRPQAPVEQPQQQPASSRPSAFRRCHPRRGARRGRGRAACVSTALCSPCERSSAGRQVPAPCCSQPERWLQPER